jgi:lipooligosaccharide transport system permease protein
MSTEPATNASASNASANNASAISAPAAAGRTVGHFRAALLRLEGHWTWYRRYWHMTLFSSVLQPLLFLVAMGIGFGSQVRPGAVTGGTEYLVYLAPALLVSGAVQNAVGESSYPVLSGFKWQKDYFAVTATPITPGELLGGQLFWVTLRVLGPGVAYLAIAACFGALRDPAVLLVLPVALLAALACAAPVMGMAASMYSEGDGFVALFRFVVVPMMLFAGTFFPVSSLPAVVRPVAWVTPLWHGTELARAAAFGWGDLPSAAGHLAYLLAWLVAGILFARARFYRRLMS